ncbi:MAG: PrsW family intramembrane metalloprotease [Spirochaetaceae bacterium]|nr:MAG: PrsW family intramembrane metalloprotease [Spirochaetaceae bacterium]
MQPSLPQIGTPMRLLINTALTALFSLGLLALLTGLYRRAEQRRGAGATGAGGQRIERSVKQGPRRRSADRRSFAREFLFGVLAALVVVVTRALFAAAEWNPLHAALLVVSVAALSEESGKLAALCLSRIGRGPLGFSEAVAAGAAVGLGFALVENSWYVTERILPLLFRGFTAVPLHAVAAGFLGWGVASPLRPGRLLPAWLIAILLHTTYNAMITTGGLPAPFTVVLIGIGAALLLAITAAAD